MDARSALDVEPTVSASADSVEQGLHLLRCAAGVLPELGAPSPLGTILFTATYAGAGDGRGRGISAAIALLGYACRLTQPPRLPPEDAAAEISSALAFTRTGELDYELLAVEPARIGALIEHTAALASTSHDTTSLTGCSEEAWTAFTEAAAHHLGKTFVRHGVDAEEMPLPHAFERLLRLGYAVRIVDEIARERPATRLSATTQVTERTRRRSHADAESWLRDAVEICLESFDPVVERMLEAAARESLILDSAEEPSPELIDVAVATTRFGFALRWCEYATRPAPVEPAEAEWHRTLAPDAGRILEAIRDVVRYGYHGGPDALLERVPGAGPDMRSAVLECSGRDLVLQGYLLQRVLEVHPDWLTAIRRSLGEDGALGSD